ncbi:hypothetical protein [Legionella sainthelensi]|uniref:hypothetical protein n=1 Tax=Legionella sainthelensi TaxID=28087 RepID=UPI00135B4FA4|nr:hypothetical protein [Legionella sainthelensi]
MLVIMERDYDVYHEAILEEQFIINVMLQSWEDCLMMRRCDEILLDFWLDSFLTWAPSPYFKIY